ncbi:hypothetical protein KAS41_02690 [Candidatus Parcubacteria bacterium]|nr:hypothetical protein [Candidatus Parcubacteria bacterium]
MPKTKTPINIKIVSIGNRGCNILERLSDLAKNSVELCPISVAGKVFNRLNIKNKIELLYNDNLKQNKNIRGTVKQIIGEKQKEIMKLADKTDAVFLVSNLSNKISAIQTKEIARLFKKEGSLVFFVGSTAFDFEGEEKQKTAEEMTAVLKKEVDALLIVDNEKIAKQEIKAIDAFTQIDKIVADIIVSVLDIVAKCGVINIDFADLKAIVKNSGEALGLKKDTTTIIDNLFNQTNLIKKPDYLKKVLYVIYSGKNLLMDEVKQIGEKIHKKLNDEGKIIFGIVNDDKMKDELL